MAPTSLLMPEFLLYAFFLKLCFFQHVNELINLEIPKFENLKIKTQTKIVITKQPNVFAPPRPCYPLVCNERIL